MKTKNACFDPAESNSLRFYYTFRSYTNAVFKKNCPSFTLTTFVGRIATPLREISTNLSQTAPNAMYLSLFGLALK
jgi:hypothetical protein